MPHFRKLSPDVRERLEARGIDPEASCEAWLEAIRAGEFPLTPDGLPRRPEKRAYSKLADAGDPRLKALTPIPLALVIP